MNRHTFRRTPHLFRDLACIPLLAACTLSGCATEKPREEPPPAVNETPLSPPPAVPTPIGRDTTPPATPPSAPAPAAPPAVTVAEAAPATREIFPHIRIATDRSFIEIDGFVPIDAHNEKTTIVYLEQLVCLRDTKDHESVVVTDAKPSNIHAALLLMGTQPGSPGAWDWEGEEIRAIPPTGAPLIIEIIFADGAPVPATDTVITTRADKTLTQLARDTGDEFRFGGSEVITRQGRERYRADGEGTIIGLTTFGGEVIGWSYLFNPDSGIEDPHWIANKAVVPPFGTKAVVRITRPAARGE